MDLCKTVFVVLKDHPSSVILSERSESKDPQGIIPIAQNTN